MSNEVDFLEKAGQSNNASEILKRLRTYDAKSGANCIIVCETDSCFKTFEDIICSQGGWRIFKPVAWNPPATEELVEVSGKFLYHPGTKTFWIDTSHGPVLLSNPDAITGRRLLEKVAEMGY